MLPKKPLSFAHRPGHKAAPTRIERTLVEN
jgi:hypothetical protein